MLDDQIRKRIKGKQQDDAAEARRLDGGGGHGRPARRRRAALRAAADRQLRRARGSAGGQDAAGVGEVAATHRRDKDANGVYDEAEAVRIMDAWWPRWVAAEFKPTLGGEALRRDPAASSASTTRPARSAPRS